MYYALINYNWNINYSQFELLSCSVLFCPPLFSEGSFSNCKEGREEDRAPDYRFSGQAERLLLCSGYRRKLFSWISAGALISDTLQAAVSFGESLFPNIRTVWLRDDNAMEILLSCLDTLSTPLWMHSVCFLKWSKIFWLCLNTRADHPGRKWAVCQQEARRHSAPCLGYVPSFVLGWACSALCPQLCDTRNSRPKAQKSNQ